MKTFGILLLLVITSPVFAMDVHENTELSKEEIAIKKMMKKIEQQDIRAAILCQTNTENGLSYQLQESSAAYYGVIADQLEAIADYNQEQISNGLYDEINLGDYRKDSDIFNEISYALYEDNREFISCLGIRSLQFYQTAKLLNEFASENRYYILKLKAKLLAEKGREFFDAGVDKVFNKADEVMDSAVEFTKRNMSKLQNKVDEYRD